MLKLCTQVSTYENLRIPHFNDSDTLQSVGVTNSL